MRARSVICLVAVLLVTPLLRTQEDSPAGLVSRGEGAFEGYTLYSPYSRTTFLIDLDGRVVHQWETEASASSVYLLDNGHLMFNSQESHEVFRGGGQGGRIQEYDWEGNKVWDYLATTDTYQQHHDIEPMPNGNVLMIVWESKDPKEALAAGRHPQGTSDDGFWPDAVYEVEPIRPDGGRIVWQWHSWDHLIQDFDEGADLYGSVLDHPERIDINADRRVTELSSEERNRMRALGYLVGDDGGRSRRGRADWLHTNAISYNPQLDQIALSSPNLAEVWVIDHSTTTEEAASSEGGRYGKGGDLLYRWGNPVNYRRGTMEDQTLFFQHDVRWIPEGSPGAGHLTVFNNGRGRPGSGPDKDFSSVDQVELPTLDEGVYFIEDGLAFEPFEADWSYSDPGTFFSSFISGAHRLANGNTIIASGAQRRIFEVTMDGDVVWDFRVPPGSREGPHGPPERAGGPGRGGPGGGRGNPSAGLFRATRLSVDHPAFQGRTLKPLDPQPEGFGPRTAKV